MSIGSAGCGTNYSVAESDDFEHDQYAEVSNETRDDSNEDNGTDTGSGDPAMGLSYGGEWLLFESRATVLA